MKSISSLVLLPNMAQSINITELHLPQLEMLKNQLDQEVEFFSTSIAQLKVVQTKCMSLGSCMMWNMCSSMW
uniref:Uncharacterized protein n=1 Tax=Macaca fascicularis TaxID=9541 RepID=A0A2K5WSD3_MACFA